MEISLALGIVGVVGLLWLKGFNGGPRRGGLHRVVERVSFSFIAVPLFVFMSGILLHSGIGKGPLHGGGALGGVLPGGLAVASIFSCAIFAAISGSSVATAATIGMIAIPEMERRGYRRPLIFGSLAAGGTLGILIPPSIPMIIYGVMTETSIGHLYMAGMIPGVMLAAALLGLRDRLRDALAGGGAARGRGPGLVPRQAALALRGGAGRASSSWWCWARCTPAS